MNAISALLLIMPIAVAIANDSAPGDAAGIATNAAAAPDAHTSRTRVAPRVPPADVSRGQKVQVTVWSGAVLLKFEAEAESTARTGQTVIVRNLESGRRFVARVEEKGKVVVQK